MTAAWPARSTPPAAEPATRHVPPGPLAARADLRGSWSLLATRWDGTEVWRVAGQPDRYVKVAPDRPADDLRFSPTAEADRSRWLAGHGFPVAEVLDVGAGQGWVWLVTRALPGVAAANWPAAGDRQVLRQIAELAAALHRLPVADCPFDGGLDRTLSWARQAVAQELLDLDDLDQQHAGRSGPSLLAELLAQPAPAEDTVVCHGDLSLDNILLEPETGRVSGVLDTGRLGRADRWRDLAVLGRNLCGEYPGWQRPGGFAELLQAYGTELVPAKFDYYRLLDEFF